MGDVADFCARRGIKTKTLLHVALRSAMEDPGTLAKAQAHEAALNAQRRQIRLQRQAVYRHHSLL